MSSWFAPLVLAIVGMLTATSATAADACFPPAGYMRSIQGQVEIKRGAVDWRPAALNDPLCAGDLIRVGDRSRGEAAIANLTKRIDQNTTLSLTYVPEDKPAVVGLLEGAVYFFSRKPRVLEVDTPYFDAAIEGTEFLVRVESQRALLTVFDGRITARNAQGELTVASGQSLVAEAGQAPAPYVLVRPRDAVQWALYYPIILLPLADRSGMAARDIGPPLGEAVELASRGEFAAAFARFDAIPELERGPEFYLYRAATLLSVGRVEEARADIDQALLHDPTDGRAYALSAVIAVARNERDRALADAQRGIELSPRSAAARIALSYAEQARFRIEAARDTMQQAVQDEPENALAWAQLSELWLMQGYRDRALKAAKKARKFAPELERVETVLGFAALAAIDIGKAKKAFRRAIELDSASPRARFGLGLAIIRDGDLEEGRREIETAVALDPDDSLLRSYLGKAYFDERTTDPGKYLRELFTNFPNQENTLAAEQYAIAKRLDPNDPTPWLYNAIRLQSENRPVEALRDIEKSIELNDNRAVYRSRELLDQDQASRGTSLARIYNDLGFEQLGINEATKSLSYDPANAAAHRFLSDTYAALPGREMARVSELLQAQLLQDININPVQPSLSETNLNIFTGGGPATVGFNEFTPLFERNQAQLNATGLIGSNWTHGDEAVVSGVYDNISISAGQFLYKLNGFRKEFNLEQDVYDAFAQAALTPQFNMQAEFRRRQSKEGDIQLNFDPETFDPLRRRRFEQDTARLGVRFSLSPRSDVIGSVIYSDRSNNIRSTIISSVPQTQRVDENGGQGEARYIFRGNQFNITSGLGIYKLHTDLLFSIPPFSVPFAFPGVSGLSSFTTEQKTGYLYADIRVPENLVWTIGLSYDDYSQEPLDQQKLNPKFGMEWDITQDLRLRLAVLRSLMPAVFASQTVQPVQVSGFNQFFDDARGTESWLYALGFDAHIADNVYSGIELSRRDWQELNPVVGQDAIIREWIRQDRSTNALKGYLYWVFHPHWILSADPQYAVYEKQKGVPPDTPRRVRTASLPLSVRYFSPVGIFASLGATAVHQDVNREVGSTLPEGSYSFVTCDVGAGFRFPQRRGIVNVQVRNIFDTSVKFQDESYLWYNNASTISPYFPERTILASLTLNF